MTDGESQSAFDGGRLAVALGLSAASVEPSIDYLVAEGLLERPAFGGQLQVTHEGVREYERAIANPAERTSQYFPAVQVITNNISQMVNSSIQQGTVRSSQTLTITQTEGEGIAAVLPKLVEFAATLAHGAPRQTLEAAIATIEAQKVSPVPSRSIIRESLATARSVVEKASGSILAAEVLRLLATGVQ